MGGLWGGATFSHRPENRLAKETGGMDALNPWDVALFAVAGYIAIVSLVRLMLGRRATLARQIQEDLERRQTQDEEQSQQSEADRPGQPARPQPAAQLAKKKA